MLWPVRPRVSAGKALKSKANEGQQQSTTLRVATGGWLDYMHMCKAPVLEQVLAPVLAQVLEPGVGVRNRD